MHLLFFLPILEAMAEILDKIICLNRRKEKLRNNGFLLNSSDLGLGFSWYYLVFGNILSRFKSP